MDDYMFRYHVNDCRSVVEQTSYLEIFNYSDPFYNSREEHPLEPDEFDNFLHRRGAFAPPTKMKAGTTLLHGIRLVLQKSARDKDTFSPHVISLKRHEYESMVRTLRLPFRAIEGTSVVGPFFWTAYDQDKEDPHLQIVFRKSDVRKKGKTRGWELMLSHSFRTAITTGFVKGTPSSDIESAIKHLLACYGQVGHPLLLPVIILSYDLSSKNDEKQRAARDWLRKLEHAVSMRNEIEEDEGYVDKDGVMELDAINRDLVECHSQVLWKRPQAFREIVHEMERAMVKFWDRLDEERKTGPEGERLEALHKSMLARLDFYVVKLKGIEHYAHTTLERLKIQRDALYNLIATRESKISLQIAGEQQRLAHASKRDSTAMKLLSLLGAVFLPGTYLASVFSMTFFDFRPEQEGVSVVSPDLWIYFVVAIPLTMIIVGSWLWFDRRRELRFAQEDADLEKNITKMEGEIMAMMRKRTMSKTSTWNTMSPPPRP